MSEKKEYTKREYEEAKDKAYERGFESGKSDGQIEGGITGFIIAICIIAMIWFIGSSFITGFAIAEEKTFLKCGELATNLKATTFVNYPLSRSCRLYWCPEKSQITLSDGTLAEIEDLKEACSYVDYDLIDR